MSQLSRTFFVRVAVLVGILLDVHGLVVTKPCCSTLPHQPGAFGVLLPEVESDLVRPNVVEEVAGEVVQVPGYFCNSSEAKVVVTGKIVLVARGQCSFLQKVWLRH